MLRSALQRLAKPYALIGGIAVVLRGYDRATQDIDALIMDADNSVGVILDAMREQGLAPRVENPEEFAARYRVLLLQAPDGTGIDLTMGLLPFEEEVAANATIEKLTSEIEMPTATAEDLIIMKLIAARSRDIEDARRLAELHPQVNRTRIFKVVSHFAEALEQPELLTTMKEILGEG